MCVHIVHSFTNLELYQKKIRFKDSVEAALAVLHLIRYSTTSHFYSVGNMNYWHSFGHSIHRNR